VSKFEHFDGCQRLGIWIRIQKSSLGTLELVGTLNLCTQRQRKTDCVGILAAKNEISTIEDGFMQLTLFIKSGFGAINAMQVRSRIHVRQCRTVANRMDVREAAEAFSPRFRLSRPSG
jgi:hypothetical protein